MPHACAFFVAALFFCAWLHLRKREAMWAWAVIGGTLGLAALVQWQSAAFVAVPAVHLLWRSRRVNLTRLLVCVVAAVLAFSPQMLGWQALYGTPVLIPDGPGGMAWFHPAVFRVLFSAREGLLTWTPLMAAGLLGLFFWPKEDKTVCVALAVAVLMQVYLAACAGDAGASFGMRRLVHCAPVFGAGLAVLFSRRPASSRPRWTAAAVALCVVWNALFVMQYAGLLDSLYLNEALYTLSGEQQVSVDALATMDRLPDGTPFDLEEFAGVHRFPRDTAPSLRQFIPDKLTVLLVFGRRVVGATAPGLLTG